MLLQFCCNLVTNCQGFLNVYCTYTVWIQKQVTQLYNSTKRNSIVGILLIEKEAVLTVNRKRAYRKGPNCETINADTERSKLKIETL